VNLGSLSFSELKDVNVFGFASAFGLAPSAISSLPLGNHFSASDFTAFINIISTAKELNS
jgi:hypothetical protein